MKKTLILFFAFLFSIHGIAQDKSKSDNNEIKQFYRTIQGDYSGQINDSSTLSIHFTPIWETENDPFHWLYLEATNNETKEVVVQKVLEIKQLTDITFQIVIRGLSAPEKFIGKWSNRNFFDGYNASILKGKKKVTFLKTKDLKHKV